MTDGPQYKMVNGELVPLTPEEMSAIEAYLTKAAQSQAISSSTLDMGKSMFQILTD